RVPVVATPHLEGRLGVAEEGHRSASPAPRGHPVRVIRRALRALHSRRTWLQVPRETEIVAIWEDGSAGGHEVGVGHEVFELVSGEHLLDAGANLPNASPLRPRGWRPFVARPVGAFGEPDATRGTTEMAAMRLHRGAKLEVVGFVAREERQIAVRG